MKYIPLRSGQFCVVDDEDFEYLSQWKWRLTVNGYVVRRILIGDHKRYIRLHRLLLNASPKVIVDHINRNKLDNRRNNLRITTKSLNGANVKAHRDNKSGFKGVYWNKKAKKWTASICANKKVKWLGDFKNIVDAARAYNKAAKQSFGEFAYLNPV